MLACVHESLASRLLQTPPDTLAKVYETEIEWHPISDMPSKDNMYVDKNCDQLRAEWQALVPKISNQIDGHRWDNYAEDNNSLKRVMEVMFVKKCPLNGLDSLQ